MYYVYICRLHVHINTCGSMMLTYDDGDDDDIDDEENDGLNPRA